jgi:HK97 family phage prohead protease
MKNKEDDEMANKLINPDGKYIKRNYELSEVRVEENGNTITGHAAVYGQMTRIGDWFYEIIAPGAFDRADLSDVAFYLNHNIDALPMARSRKSIPNSTMKVTPDVKGLGINTSLDIENNTDSRALISAVNRQDVSGMSFSFLVGDEDWQGLDTEMPTRTIKTVAKVIEVSAVTYPAYEGTDIDARSGSLESDRAALERAQSIIINQRNQSEVETLKQKIILKGMV